MRVTLEFHTDNAAFGDGDSREMVEEIGRLLSSATTSLARNPDAIGPEYSHPLRDRNGNRVGWLRFHDE